MLALTILRPTKFTEIIGQQQTLDHLKISVQSALSQNKTFPHLLLDGPPGLGKTTIAQALANELNTEIQIINGANLRSLKALLPFLTKITEKSLLFIDEIHRITSIVEEFLYPIMEDYKVTLGKKEDIIKLDIPEFTLVGATTNVGKLSKPFIDRFIYKRHLQKYNTEELLQIIKTNSTKFNLTIPDDCGRIIARCSRGTPRIANGILTWVKDFVTAKKINLTTSTIYDILDYIEIDKKGLDKNDRIYIDVLKKQDTPIGIKTLSFMTGISQETIETVIEPYLLELGIIIKTPKGRLLSIE
jgi:Holliday junction DNA helicase RuvB